MMMNEWKFKVWMNDTALNYLNSFPHTDIWSLPLEEWIYHSVAESSLLFAAISDTVPEICGPLMQTEETENTFTIAVKSLKDQYVNKLSCLISFRTNLISGKKRLKNWPTKSATPGSFLTAF